MRALPLALVTLALCALPAHALPTSFALTGSEEGVPVSGQLDLDEEQASLSVKTRDGAFKLVGKLRQRGDYLVGDLSAGKGMAGRVLGAHLLSWRVRVLSAGLKVSVDMKRRGREIQLRGETPTGKRNAQNEALIRSFYEAFVAGDAGPMQAAYHPQVHFTDPVFPNLKGADAGAMWAMLCESAPKISFSGIRAGDRYGVAKWEAHYEFLGRPIHNVIEASFEFRDGKIVRHVDSFSFKRWSKQAFTKGLTAVAGGALHGVTKMIAARQLKSFMKGK